MPQRCQWSSMRLCQRQPLREDLQAREYSSRGLDHDASHRQAVMVVGVFLVGAERTCSERVGDQDAGW